MLRDSVVVVAAVAVVRTRPRAILLAMITMRKSTHGFPFVSHMSIRLLLAAVRASGAPLLKKCIKLNWNFPFGWGSWKKSLPWRRYV